MKVLCETRIGARSAIFDWRKELAAPIIQLTKNVIKRLQKMEQKNRPIPNISESLKCFIHNPACMQQSIMLNLGGWKTADKDAWFHSWYLCFLQSAT